MNDCTDYPAGQCTRYVCETWGAPVGPVWGDAGGWIASARAAGYSTSSTPSVGAIAVWGPGHGGALGAGHVAIVTAVDPLTVREENWQGLGRVDERVVDAASAAGIIGYVEGPMTPAERADLVDAHVAELYAAVLHRDADDDPTGRDFWTGQMIAHGFGAAARAFVKAPESRTDIAHEAGEHTGG